MCLPFVQRRHILPPPSPYLPTHYIPLEVAAETFYLIGEEFHVLICDGRTLKNQPEKVVPVSQRLVGNHHGSFFNHTFFDYGGHL